MNNICIKSCFEVPNRTYPTAKLNTLSNLFGLHVHRGLATMIEYSNTLYGLGLLTRVHGSAVFKAAIPGALSAVFFLLIVFRWNPESPEKELDHPYAIGVLVTSVSFLVVFRANNAYQRYWEACSSVHHMTSKWLGR